MSREILFRGKRVDNGEWAEGLLWKKKYNHNKLFISCFPDKDDNEEVFVICPETLGQYTNRDAENGKIFEGDILQTPKGEILVAAYAGTQFTLRQLNGRAKTWLHANSYRIIGNKFDNPELLEVKK